MKWQVIDGKGFLQFIFSTKDSYPEYTKLQHFNKKKRQPSLLKMGKSLGTGTLQHRIPKRLIAYEKVLKSLVIRAMPIKPQ